MKTYWEVEIQSHAFFTSAGEGGEWSGSRPDRFTPGKASSNHWIGGCVGPRASLDAASNNEVPD